MVSLHGTMDVHELRMALGTLIFCRKYVCVIAL